METAIEVVANVQAPFEGVRAVLMEHPGILVKAAPTAEECREGRYCATMVVKLGRLADLEGDVLVELEHSRQRADSVVIKVQWHPARHETLFPTFGGEFEASRTEAGANLAIRGSYDVPLGLVGRIGEGIVGRRVAGHALQALVDQAAERLAGESRRECDNHPYHDALRGLLGSDDYLV